MSEAITSLTGALSGPTGQGIGKLLQLGLGIPGVISNISQARAQAQRQKQIDELTKNPALLAAKIKALQQPLSQGLVQDVTNQAQAQLAERGLSSSPQIATAVESQALAPYEFAEQQRATNAFLQSLGLDVGGPNALPGGPVDTSGLWGLFQPTSTTSSATPYSFPSGTGPNQIPSSNDPGIAVPPLTVPGVDYNTPPFLGPY